jgi:hypothetical protein
VQKEVTQRVDGFEGVDAAPLQGSCAGLGGREHLKAPCQVEGEHAQQLPSTVGCVAHGLFEALRLKGKGEPQQDRQPHGVPYSRSKDT